MISISYTITPTITDHLVHIDSYRRFILTTPLSPANERKLRWTACLTGITGSMLFTDTSVNKSHIIELLSHPPKRLTSPEQSALSYKQALEWIRENWTANPKAINLSTLETLVSVMALSRTVTTAFRDEEASIRHLLTYLQSQSDHPVIMAGIAHGLIETSALDIRTQGLISRLTATLILTKYGYDCRGLLALDQGWIEDRDRYTQAIESITKLGQLTAWLEYYTAIAEMAYESLSLAVSHAGEGVTSDLPASSWQLSVREEQLLRRMDSPTSRITNRDVQRAFHVSQVTASRDLTRLASLGLIFAHGKGRSIYYTKA
jgi:hypothetical protein